MSKYRNIPQATKDNVLHYINQVYDEAYELGYQRGRVQSDSDIKSAQQMIEDAIKNLRELKEEPKRGKWEDMATPLGASYGRHEFVCSECDYAATYFVGGSEEWWDTRRPNYCPNCGADMRGDEE